MYLQSILIIGGNAATRLVKAKEIAPSAFEVSPTSIDDIREIRKTIALGQSVIIHDAHNLSEEAQNALLKTLEEPPENTQLLLLTTNSELLLSTILSRCQVIELPNKTATLTQEEQQEMEKILSWVGSPPTGGDLKNGFAWSKEFTDRKSAIESIDRLLIAAHQSLKSPTTIRRLFQAKKYLLANTNVRLTLENLFIN